jgi:peptidoglycan/xylan/chitin deacetylase (PgdA/CDA1 family)
MGVDRRQLLRVGFTFVGGVAAGVAALKVPGILGPDRLPISGGYAPGGVARGWSTRGGVVVHWHIPTDRPLVALTFDDGPGPDWTPTVLDALDRHDVPATFFVVGRRLARYEALVRDRFGRHEIANHTWDHRDLAKLDERGVRDQLSRTHDVIHRVTGQTSRLLRPPWGHLGGSTLVVADEFDYDVVMWSQQMREQHFADDPPAQTRDIVGSVSPGSVVLAHDIGPRYRLVTINQLDGILTGFRDRGLRQVTVSELIASATPGGE